MRRIVVGWWSFSYFIGLVLLFSGGTDKERISFCNGGWTCDDLWMALDHRGDLLQVPISTSRCTFTNARRCFSTYVIASLLIFISLLVLGSLGLIWSALLLVQCLPSLTEDLADLACELYASATAGNNIRKEWSYRSWCQGSHHGRSHAAHWRRTCTRRGHA